MRTRLWSTIEGAAGLLDEGERQSVLGDIHERGATVRALFDLLGLVALRQLQAWKSWRPWAMTALLALPATFAGLSTHPIAFIVRTGHLLEFESAAGTFVIQPWQLLKAAAAAWAIGFALARLGQRRSASVLFILIAISGWNSYQTALGALRIELPPSWLTRFQLDYTFTQHIASAVQLTDENARLAAAIALMTLLVAIPCLRGFRRGLAPRPLTTTFLVTLFALCLPAIFDMFHVVMNGSPWRWPRTAVSWWPFLYTIAFSRRSANRVIHNV